MLWISVRFYEMGDMSLYNVCLEKGLDQLIVYRWIDGYVYSAQSIAET